jgi:hypothetical protein
MFDEIMSAPVRPQARHGEPRWPASLATLVAVGLYAALPSELLIGPRYIVPVLELLLLAVLVVVNPGRMNRQTTTVRGTSLVLIYLIMLTNAISLGLLLHRLVVTGSDRAGALLIAALQVWLTNVIVFALSFWELDRGGPVVRHRLQRPELPGADFRFPQDENQDAVTEVAKASSARSNWMPRFVDYLYVSLTNSSAFSPTDTMPLSGRVKLLMGAESTMALITSVVVIAKGVGSLR